MSKETVQQEVRMRERFLCASCRQRAGEQYAHIIPESDGGEYLLNNIIFLCWFCHNQLEAARTNPLLKEKLITLARTARDTPKADGLLEAIFTFVGNECPTIALGGGMRIVNWSPVLEKDGEPDDPYLKLNVDARGALSINASFEDADGSVIMRIQSNKLLMRTRDTWDIHFERRHIHFESKRHDVCLNIQQDDNLDLVVTGSLYLNGGLFNITRQSIHDVAYGNVYSGNSSEFNGYGVLLKPGGGVQF